MTRSAERSSKRVILVMGQSPTERAEPLGSHNLCPALTSHRFSTVRPVKKVDEAASQRLSAEFIGTGSVRRMSQVAASGSTVKAPPQPESPTRPKQPITARGKAGQVLVEQVMLGVLDTVSGTVRNLVGPRISMSAAESVGRPSR
jgi:hypothetical protein